MLKRFKGLKYSGHSSAFAPRNISFLDHYDGMQTIHSVCLWGGGGYRPSMGRLNPDLQPTSSDVCRSAVL